jgi:hypothetical protein
MHGTFFVNSGRLDSSSYYMGWDQVRGLAGDGNEIGGHTVDHANLPSVQASNLDEAKREVCNDRVTLLNEGFQVSNFAYPYGAYDDTTKQIAQQCGYNSARDVSGVVSPGSCDGCPFAESVPPADPYRTRTPQNVFATTSLAEIESYVTQAEQNGGGWVQLVLHHICSGCGENYAITQSDFGGLLDWLAARPATTSVKTVAQVVGGAVSPGVPGPAAANLPGPNLMRNASVEAAAGGSTPDCWDPIGYGTNTGSFRRTSDAHSGSFAERLDVTSFTSGAQRLLSHMDLGGCAPSVTPGNSYTVGAYYKSSVQPVFEVYTRDARGRWSWWMTTAKFAASSGWSRATFTTPAIPSGVTAVSVGLGLLSTGSLTTDDYSLVDRGVIPPPTNVLQNAGLETLGVGGGDPTCWGRGQGGANAGSWAHTSDAHGGSNAEVATISSYVSGDSKLVSQQDATLLNPTLTSATAAASGGSLADGAYFYKLTAVNARGETLASNERSATTSGGSGSVALSWPAVSGATGYKVYRGSASGAETLLATVGAVTSYTDTGAATPGLSTPPTANTALKVAPCAPAATPGHTYQVGAWYKTSAGASARFVIYYRDASGNWIFWKAQPIAASTTWAQATTVTDTAPPGATALGMGVSLLSAGTLTADDLSLGDLTAADASNPPPCGSDTCDTIAPGSSASSPAYGQSGPLTVSYTAADDPGGSGLARVDLYAKGPGDLAYSKVTSDTAPSTSGSFGYLPLGDGAYSFYTVATDTAGNTQAAPAGPQTTTVVDSTAPSSSASAPAVSASNALRVSYAATDGGSGLARVELYAKAPGQSAYTKVATDSTPGASGSFNYTAAAGDGSYSFYTIATDKAGNVQAAPSTPDATTALDATAPSSSASSPAVSATNTVTVSYTARDSGSGLARVELYAKAPGQTSYTKVATDSTPGPSGTFNYTATNGDGNYSFYTIATDQAANTQPTPTNADATTTVDTTAPTSKATAPTTTFSSSITVAYTASDSGSGLAQVDLYAKAPGETSYTKIATDNTPSTSGNFSYTASAGDGNYSFYTLATDKAGNQQTTPTTPDATTSVTPDAAAPASSASSPAYGTTTAVPVSFTASDTGGSGLASVELWVKAPGQADYAKAATNTSGNGSGSFAYTVGSGDGAYAFYTVAVDRAGNREAAPAGADASTTVDTAAPSAFQMTDPGQYLRGSVALSPSGAPTDAGSGLASVAYQYRLNGSSAAWSPSCTATATTWSCNWNTATAATPDGSYDLRAVATDRAGNTTVASNTPLSARVIDNAKPAAKSIASANVTGGVAGKAQPGDSLTFTYSETMSPGSILPGWNGTSTAVQVRITNGGLLLGNSDTLTVWRSGGSARLALADPLALGGNYVPLLSNAVFNATMVQTGSSIKVTLGTLASGSVSGPVTGGTLSWTPDANATDLANNRVTTTSVSARGPAF